MPLFPRLHQVVRVEPARWNPATGEWTAPPEPEPVGHALNVQPKDDRLVAFGGTAFPLKQGDILLYPYTMGDRSHERWVCVNVRVRDMLGPDTAHVRYEFRPEQQPGG